MKIPALPLRKNDPVRKTILWNGVPIDLEWPKGSTRMYENSDFRKYMHVAYGYIRNTTTKEDNEEIDVYVEEKALDSSKVFKITQLYDPKEGGSKEAWSFDEYKFMIGFENKEEAKNTYIKCMTKDHFGGITELSVSQFLSIIKKGSM